MKIHKLLIMLLILLFTFLSTSCNNETIQSSENQTSAPSSIPIQSTVSIRPNISGKDDLWADKKLTVGFIGPGAVDAWNTQLIKYTRDISCKEWNVELEFRDGQSKSDLQIEHMEELIEMDVDAIGLISTDEIGWGDAFTKAKEAGIPIILIDRKIYSADESLWTSHIANDWEKEGEMAGEWITENIIKKGETEEIKLIELTGYSDYITHYSYQLQSDKIAKGFRKVIENTNIKIIDSLNGDFTRAGGYEKTKEALEKKTDIDIIFCHDDDMALGAIEAIEEAGLVPGEDIIIVSIMGTNAALKAIVEGKIACSVECNPFMGDLFMEACVRLANGEEIEREIHPVDRVFDITNAQAELDARKANGYGY